MGTVSLNVRSYTTHTWTYGYNSGTGVITGISDGVMTQGRERADGLGRITGIHYRVNGQELLGWNYGYDAVMIARRTLTQSSVSGLPGWNYSYNNRGEVVSALRTYSNASTPVPWTGVGLWLRRDRQNRTAATRGVSPAPVYATSYSANNLNQYSAVLHPDAVEINGLTATGVPTVQINGQPSSGRPSANGEPGGFALWAPRNGSGAVGNWLAVTTSARWLGGGPNGVDLDATWSGYTWMPPATESPQYDLDGNLTQDARFNYAWDAENRLIAVQTRSDTTPGNVPLFRAIVRFTMA